jgi:hypothetical protein
MKDTNMILNKSSRLVLAAAVALSIGTSSVQASGAKRVASFLGHGFTLTGAVVNGRMLWTNPLVGASRTTKFLRLAQYTATAVAGMVGVRGMAKAVSGSEVEEAADIE